MNIMINNSTSSDFIQKHELKKDFWISFMDLSPSESIEFDYKKDHGLIDFGFILNGRINNKIENRNLSRETIENTPGTGGIMYSPEAEGHINIPGKQRLQVLHIHISRELLFSMLMDGAENTPGKFQNILEGKNGSFLSRGKMDHQVKLCVSQIFTNEEPGLPINIYREAKALELISLQLKWLYQRDRKIKTISFTQRERRKIFDARELIESRAGENPTVSEVSQIVGLGINKLNFGFKEIFGCTVAGFIREQRMQDAKLMLDTGDLNVSEVAWNIGYTNVSHFSSAFKKRFDILPGTYLLGRKRRIFGGYSSSLKM